MFIIFLKLCSLLPFIKQKAEERILAKQLADYTTLRNTEMSSLVELRIPACHIKSAPEAYQSSS